MIDRIHLKIFDKIVAYMNAENVFVPKEDIPAFLRVAKELEIIGLREAADSLDMIMEQIL